MEWALPPVRAWFEGTFGTPTRAQREGWPAIASGQHALICAPTGTGKTLAAFLAGLDLAWRAASDEGVKILYVSPLKALNADVAVNLEVPLLGVVREAERMGMPLRPLSVGVRTGDTPAAERAAQRKRPPDILITTPESLHLILASRQRETLRGVTHVIVDEIHELCSRKRGVSLAVLLERLCLLADRDCVRIGLSATVDPKAEVAAFLGGWEPLGADSRRGQGTPRPVTIIDAGSAPALELTVRSVNRSGTGGGRDDLDDQLLESIERNRSTLIFANHRGEVERLTSRLNERLARRVVVSGTPGRAPVVRSHHGSLSLDQRRATEAGLKDGSLRAVVATASLELGIDVGTIDQVCQIGSPGSVARGLQRVGRSGHSITEVSRACLFARTDSERLELVALADAMREGRVEPLRIPGRCLDVLAQQILACVALESWEIRALYEFLKRAHPYRDLPWDEFEAVVAMLSGRSPRIDVRDLRARIHWDCVAGRLEALPGTRRLAVQGGNTIPDSGQVPVVLEGATRLGELDEDFVMERRAGDVIQLGTSSWVIRSIDSRRVLVGPAEGRSAIVPFWRGEGLGRSGLLGNRLGALRRQIAGLRDDDACGAWLGDHFRLDPGFAQLIVKIVRRQIESVGHVPSDRTVLVESFLDESRCLNLLIQTPLGRRFHLGISLVVQGWSRGRFGTVPVGNASDDGLLMVFPGSDIAGADLFRELIATDWKALLIRELWDSPLFQVRFRQVLNRALPMAGAGTSARAPLWYQRHRAESLFETVIEDREHPLIRETLRECLAEDLGLAELEAFFRDLSDGLVSVETVPMGHDLSPFAAELLQQMMGRPQARRPLRRRRRSWNEQPPETDPPPPLSPGPIDREAVDRLESRLRGRATPPRTAGEMAEFLRFCGDLDESELAPSVMPLLEELRDRGKALRIEIAGASPPSRWIATESLARYEAAFEVDCAGSRVEALDDRERPQRPGDEALIGVVQSWIRSHAVVAIEALAARYGVSISRARQIIARLERSGELVSLPGSGDAQSGQWAERRNLEDLQRLTLALRRKESVCVDPEAFADALVRHHALDQSMPRGGGHESQGPLLQRLACFPAPLDFWEVDVLQRRMNLSNPGLLDQFLRTEQWSWRCVDEPGNDREIALVPPGFAGPWAAGEHGPRSSDAELVLSMLSGAGSVETDDLLAQCQLDAGRGGAALEELWKQGVIGGDHLDPVRGALRKSPTAVSRAQGTRPARRSRRDREAVGAGRWESSGVKWVAYSTPGAGSEGGEGAGIDRWVSLLLNRYGVVCKETARLDRWAPPWSLLRAALDLAELRGEVRRGYFVAGLSGVQFASESFAGLLRASSRQEARSSTPVLVSAMDPANLYGPGAPFPFPDQGGKGIRFARSRSNHLVLMKGRPLIVSEHYARRLTVLPWADEGAIAEGAGLLCRLAGPGRRVLQVLEINGHPAMTSPFAEHFRRVGFVRNPPGLAFYAGWSDGPFA